MIKSQGEGLTLKFLGAVWLVLVLALTACSTPATTSTTTAPTTSPSGSPTPTYTLNQYQLAYRLLERYPDYFWCDPDFYPIGRPGGEESNSLEQFPAIQSNAAEFAAILEHLKLPIKLDYSNSEKLDIYREHKKLTRALEITPSGNSFQYVIRVGQNQGSRIEGTISPSGTIIETKKEASFNTCPICLAQDTSIDTPDGPVPVQEIRPGMIVWSLNDEGQRVAVPVKKTSSTPVPSTFQILEITLSDGRVITASPGHPTAEYKALGEYRIGEILDGSAVSAVRSITYAGRATYDILPDGDTGFYWANGVLLLSTLK